SDREQRRKETGDLPNMLASAGYVLRRVHLIRAYGDWIADADAMMTEAEQNKEQRYHVVLAEVDRPEGLAIAERAPKLPDLSLWLASHDAPLALARGFTGEQAKRFKALLDRADGWTRCDHLVSSSGEKSRPATPTNEFPAKVVAQQLRSVT